MIEQATSIPADSITIQQGESAMESDGYVVAKGTTLDGENFAMDWRWKRRDGGTFCFRAPAETIDRLQEHLCNQLSYSTANDGDCTTQIDRSKEIRLLCTSGNFTTSVGSDKRFAYRTEVKGMCEFRDIPQPGAC